ncbi:MAG TPA: helix-turn-helix domain-containing protein [Anaerolineae bacterium]|nr:helix-turn-helix domain-containing protein [Anaerolineae bacterium]
MSDLGSQLRLAREAKGLTLEQVFKATRIKATYLEALESNRIDALPGLTQARGFVRSYANYLGLNGEALASTLDTGNLMASTLPPAPVESATRIGLPNRRITAEPTTPKPIPPTTTPAATNSDRPALQPAAGPVAHTPVQSTSKLRVPTLSATTTRSASTLTSGIPTPLLLVGAVVLFLIGAVLIISALSGGAKTPAPDSSTSSDSTLTVTSTTAPTQSIALANVPVSLTLVASEHVWVRVTVDGQTAFEGMLEPNAAQKWTATDQIIVETGNAAAVSIAYNGQTAELGQRGQVVARAWTRAGVEDVPVAAPDHSADLPTVPTSIATTTLQP